VIKLENVILKLLNTENQNRNIEEKRTFEPEDIGPNIQLHEPLYSLLPLCDGC
jgi:hypothetical protein